MANPTGVQRGLRYAAVALLGLSLGFCSGDRREGETPANDSTVAPRSASADSSTSPITTAEDSYTLRRTDYGWTTEIDFTYLNAAADTVYLVHCNDHILMDLEKFVEGDWVPAWYGETNSCLSEPIEIDPGATFARQLDITGMFPSDPSFNSFLVEELEGTYRLVWRQPRYHFDGVGPGLGDTLALADRRSNEFRLRTSE